MLTIYKASAGSGKTYNLTLEYIKLLLGIKPEGKDTYVLNSDKYAPGGHRRSNRHRGILAITFTNAATEEMKRRIIRELNFLATDRGRTTYTGRLTGEYGCTPDELSEAARRALSEMLYDYGGFNVSTIDSFFQTVLRTFSREVDHQGDYELTLDEREAVSVSVSLMLDELNYAPAGKSEPLLQWIRSFTMAEVQQGRGYNFFQREGSILRRLSGFMTSAMDETYRQYADRIAEYLEDGERANRFASELRDRIANYHREAAELGARFFDTVKSSGLNLELFNSTLANFTRKIVENPAEITNDNVKGKTVQKCLLPDGEFDDFTLISKSKFKKEYKGLEAMYISAGQLMRQALACYVPARQQADTDRVMLDAVGRLQFLGHALSHLCKYLKDNNLVMISDTGELLKRIISDAEMPFIYERLGMRLTNLLIDEFQDTSHLQWHNLRPLVANSLAESHDNLIIGDEKQAIYRFRNSDSELLGTLVAKRDFPNDHTLRGSAPADNTNRRSSGTVVRFNNTVFRNMAAVMQAPGYGNVVQTPDPGRYDDPAYVRVLMYEKKNVSHEAILNDMAAQMQRQHGSGYAWRDILVLVRSRKEAVETVAFLSENYPEIKILSDEALLLSSSAAVRTVVSMLKLVERSYSEDIPKPEPEQAPVYAGRSEVELMETRFNYFSAQGMEVQEALEKALDNNFAANDVADEVRAIRLKNPANLVALIEAIIAMKLTPEERTSEHAYLTALQDLAVKHCEGAEASVAAFIAAYDRNVHRWAIKAPSDIDAVQIMTIHKSKGLEQKCVHIPFAGWNLFSRTIDIWLPLSRGYGDIAPEIVPPALRIAIAPSSPIFEEKSAYGDFCRSCYQDNVIDSLNLCYVAFTRAKNELNIYASVADADSRQMGLFLKQAIEYPGPEADASTLSLAKGKLAELPPEYADYSDVYIFGEPTTLPAEQQTASPDELRAAAYPVVFRKDTRELTAIDNDLFSVMDIGGEVDKEITDLQAPFTGTPEMIEAARVGNHLHAILADMRTEDDLERSLRRAGVRFGLQPEIAVEYCEKIRRAFAEGGGIVADWFKPENKVFAERSIYKADSDESFRPDRVVETPDGRTIVIDYKFTTRPRESHRRQLELYLSLLSRLGHNKLQGYLWYPLLGKIIGL